jgi:hypothetical protein
MPTIKKFRKKITVEVPELLEKLSPPQVDYPMSGEELAEMYYDDLMSVRDIAKQTGRGETTIRRWMNLFGIERRNYSQATINHYRKLREENDDPIGD